jgi:hypothetical protein
MKTTRFYDDVTVCLLESFSVGTLATREFPVGAADPKHDEHWVERLRFERKRAEASRANKGIPGSPHMFIMGSATRDDAKTEAAARQLSEQRAQNVAAQLRAAGLLPDDVTILATGWDGVADARDFGARGHSIRRGVVIVFDTLPPPRAMIFRGRAATAAERAAMVTLVSSLHEVVPSLPQTDSFHGGWTSLKSGDGSSISWSNLWLIEPVPSPGQVVGEHGATIEEGPPKKTRIHFGDDLEWRDLDTPAARRFRALMQPLATILNSACDTDSASVSTPSLDR